MEQPMDIVHPAEADFSDNRLSRIRTWMQGYVDSEKLPGIIALVARRGKVVFSECCGMMDIEAAKPMRFDTIFRVYSMTKAITSVALMMLYEQGLFQLFDPVSRFIPEFANLKVFGDMNDDGSIKYTDLEREITVWHLLTHTSGLAFEWMEASPMSNMYREADLYRKDRTTAEAIQELANLPLLYQPGTAWQYSMATDVVGHLVELISGMTLDVFFEERIFKPLGMEDTAFYVPEGKLNRFAAMYTPGEGGGMLLSDAPGTSAYTKPPRFHSGGIGLVSTASDYFRFIQMLLNRGELEGSRLLGRKTVALMTMNHLPDDLVPIVVHPHTLHGCGFGLGFRVVVDSAQTGRLTSEGEYGWGGAASTSFFVDPKEELVGLFLTQLWPSRYYPNREEFKVMVYQALVN
jgi:CubicO group peptidase (beta-lactamase class C family)